MNPVFTNQLNGFLRVSIPVLVMVLVKNGWLPQALSDPLTELLVVATAWGISAGWDWIANRLVAQTKRVAAQPDVTVVVGPAAPEAIQVVAVDAKTTSVVSTDALVDQKPAP